jgi:hypothetical protein
LGVALAAMTAGAAGAQTTPEISSRAITEAQPIEDVADPDDYLARHLDARAGEDCVADLQIGASQAMIASTAADAETRLRFANALFNARLCIATLTARETLRVNALLSRDFTRGRTDPEFHSAVNQQLKARHVRLNGLLRDSAGALDSTRPRTIDTIRNDLQRALAEPAR